jgi:hypothetical protein
VIAKGKTIAGPRYSTYVSGGEVWIKVCNVKFPYKKAEPLLALPLSSHLSKKMKVLPLQAL